MMALTASPTAASARVPGALRGVYWPMAPSVVISSTMPIVYIRLRKKTCGAELGGASPIAHSIASGGAVTRARYASPELSSSSPSPSERGLTGGCPWQALKTGQSEAAAYTLTRGCTMRVSC